MNNENEVKTDIKAPQKIKGRWTVTTEDTLNDLLYRIIKEKGPITRKEISKLTNIPPTTLYDYLIGYIRRGTVEKFPQSDRRRGRPRVYYRIINF